MQRAIACFTLLVLLATSLSHPLSADVVRNHVKLLAQTTIVRIQKLNDEFQISPNVVFGGPEFPFERPIEGLTSILENLDIFQVILVHLQMAGTSQVHADVTNLQGVVRSLVSISNCPPRKAGADGHLETFLKSSTAFRVTVVSVTLNRLQTFLRKLIVNLDLLKTC